MKFYCLYVMNLYVKGWVGKNRGIYYLLCVLRDVFFNNDWGLKV